MSIEVADMPKQFRPVVLILTAAISVIAGTAGAMAWASTHIERTATETAKIVVAPVAADLEAHKAVEDKQHAWDGQRLSAIESKIDRLLERGRDR